MNTTERSAKIGGNLVIDRSGNDVIQIALGGITRLTGSGLSITQWDVFTGSLPSAE
jgi:cytochrome c oxidase assembly protein subunit 15